MSDIKICFGAIIKNESKIIRRLFESIKEFIDYWVIIDTGSTDSTLEILESFKKEIPGEIHQSEWINFETNRNELLEKTLNKGKYTLLMDADMILKKSNSNFTKKDLIKHLEENYKNPCFYLKQVNEILDWWNNRIINRSKNVWIYSVVTHESLALLKSEFDPKDWSETKINDLWISDIGDGGSKTKKLERDIRLLTENIPKETNSYKLFHMLFYLGQSYINLSFSEPSDYTEDDKNGFKSMALRIYSNAISLSNSFPVDEEELWCCNWFLAQAMHAVGYSLRQVQNQYLASFNSRPYRIEPMYELMFLAFKNNDFNSAYHFGTMCLEQFDDKEKKPILILLKPKKDNLFIRRDFHEVLFWFYFGHVCDSLGKLNIAFSCALQLKKSKETSKLYQLKQTELENWIKEISNKLLEKMKKDSTKEQESQKLESEQNKSNENILKSQYAKYIPKDLFV